MDDVAWLVCRLKTMSIPEVMWRIWQKTIQKSEQKRFKVQKSAVTAVLFNQKLRNLQLDARRMHLNLDNKNFGLNTSIPILGGYDYEQYKKQWNAGFKTVNKWPEKFSYLLEYKQRDDIGDARTNWELNRHFQFALLAKDYAASSDKKYLKEFQELFEDWNQKNPFLWGISWTSVMEVAIRCSNWCYTYSFLSGTDAQKNLLQELRIGILNMTDYIVNHYSRFSSANNHLIVEAYAIGQSGILFDHKPWIELALEILTRELPLQNYSDGINKELSLHYQSFYLEAMGLMMRLLIKNGIKVPDLWELMLNKICGYVATCIGDHGEVVAFGDNDEGKILDLQGGLNHYQYVLGLYSCLLRTRYVAEVKCCENLNWLFSENELQQAHQKTLYRPPQSVCYKEGGNTILRSRDGRVLIGIDHAALGFGSIAAHGHADALSFQMFVHGQPIFVDPGTYVYHCELESRSAFRKTENHNTVCVNGKDQSEMLGAFLWGKRAKCELIDFMEDNDQVILSARHNGYQTVIHSREYHFDRKNTLSISDSFIGNGNKEINYILAPELKTTISRNTVFIQAKEFNIEVQFFCDDEVALQKTKKIYSPKYGVKTESTGIRIKTSSNSVTTKIRVGRD